MASGTSERGPEACSDHKSGAAELPLQTDGIDAQKGQRQKHQQGLHEDMLEHRRKRRQRDADKDRERERAGPLPSQPGQTGNTCVKNGHAR